MDGSTSKAANTVQHECAFPVCWGKSVRLFLVSVYVCVCVCCCVYKDDDFTR